MLRHPLPLLTLLALCRTVAAEGYASMPDKPRFLGIEMSPPTMQTQEREGLNPNEGIQVQNIFTGTAAERAGIEPGDVILAVNGAPLTSMSDLRNEVSMTNVGDQAILTIARRGELIERKTSVQAWPAHVPFEPIDAAAEERFRDWQEKRLAQAQDEVRDIAKELEQARKDLGLDKDQETPEDIAKERAERDAALVQGIPGADPANGWKLDCSFSGQSSAKPGPATPTQSQPVPANPFPFHGSISLVTPDADQLTF